MTVPANIISAAVGLGGANRAADVHLVQKLLNAVPAPPGFLCCAAKSENGR